MSLYSKLLDSQKKGYKSFAVLLDPDKLNKDSCQKIVNIGLECKIDFFLVGGSLITNDFLGTVVKTIKDNSNVPVILFPGNNLQINSSADAIFLLSLISG